LDLNMRLSRAESTAEINRIIQSKTINVNTGSEAVSGASPDAPGGGGVAPLAEKPEKYRKLLEDLDGMSAQSANYGPAGMCGGRKERVSLG
jgi:hypothetical protein